MATTEDRPDSAPLQERTDVDKALAGRTTDRSLGRQRLSPAEKRFERGRRATGFWPAPLAVVLFLLVPVDMPAQQQALAAAVLLGVIVLRITEPVPIPFGGLIGVALRRDDIDTALERGDLDLAVTRTRLTAPGTGQTPLFAPRHSGGSACHQDGSPPRRCGGRAAPWSRRVGGGRRREARRRTPR